jgi:hypothetical protein
MGGACSTYGGEDRCIQTLVENPDGKIPLERHWNRWEDNIKMHLKEVGWGAWTGLIWLRIVAGGGHLYMR